MENKNYIKYQINKIKHMLNNYIDEENVSGLKKFFIVLDFIKSVIVYGTHTDDFFQYQFYKKRHIERKNFIVHRNFIKILKLVNDESKRDVFDSKALFNKTFKDFIGRDWLDLEECTLDEFKNFVSKHSEFLVKSTKGRYGHGISKIEIKSDTNIDDLFNELKKDSALVEEIVKQHKKMAEFNPTSVNTLRVVTLIDDKGNTNIMSSCIRTGNEDKIADNFHHKGMAALVDIDTGIVVTKGVDKEYKRYLKHPYTGKTFVGFEVPHWDKVIETVKKSSKVVPNVRYVGWDIAIGENGDIIIIEGNYAADHDVQQMPDQIGKYPLYKKILGI